MKMKIQVICLITELKNKKGFPEACPLIRRGVGDRSITVMMTRNFLNNKNYGLKTIHHDKKLFQNRVAEFKKE